MIAVRGAYPEERHLTLPWLTPLIADVTRDRLPCRPVPALLSPRPRYAQEGCAFPDASSQPVSPWPIQLATPVSCPPSALLFPEAPALSLVPRYGSSRSPYERVAKITTAAASARETLRSVLAPPRLAYTKRWPPRDSQATARLDRRQRAAAMNRLERCDVTRADLGPSERSVHILTRSL